MANTYQKENASQPQQDQSSDDWLPDPMKLIEQSLLGNDYLKQKLPACEEQIHEVSPGESLWRISSEHLGGGRRWDELYRRNHERVGEDPNLIYPGAELDLGEEVCKSEGEQDQADETTAPPPEPSTERFISLIQKIEAAKADDKTWTAERTVQAMRALGGYDTEQFQKLYGQEGYGQRFMGVDDKTVSQLENVKKDLEGVLSADEMAELQNMLAHGSKDGKEKGIAKDGTGQNVAMGHVMTGIAAGLDRDKQASLAKFLGVDVATPVDNLFTATISGDIGQQAALVARYDEVDGVQRATGDIGTDKPQSEATVAELNGDVDGFNIGSYLSSTQDGKASAEAMKKGDLKLSELLQSYYSPKSSASNPAKGMDGSVNSRYHAFDAALNREGGQDNLKSQVEKFASNYMFSGGGSKGGVRPGPLIEMMPTPDPYGGFSPGPTYIPGITPKPEFIRVGEEAGKGVDRFNEWMNTQRNQETERLLFNSTIA